MPILSSSLLKEARRRATLTQAEVGRRVGRSQTAIARWERGEVVPGLETLQELVAACGFELTLGVERAPERQITEIREHLSLSPRERLLKAVETANRIGKSAWQAKARQKAPERPWMTGEGQDTEWHDFDPIRVFEALEQEGVEYLVVGSLAAVLRGAPLVPNDRAVTLLVPDRRDDHLRTIDALTAVGAVKAKEDDAYQQADPIELWESKLCGAQIAIKTLPPGTNGYSDVNRDSAVLDLGEGLMVPVPSLLDIVRMVGASVRPNERLDRPLLRKTLELVSEKRLESRKRGGRRRRGRK